MLEANVGPENKRVGRIQLLIYVKVDTMVLVPANRIGSPHCKGGAVVAFQDLRTALRPGAYVLAVEKIAAVTFCILAPVVMIVQTTRP